MSTPIIGTPPGRNPASNQGRTGEAHSQSAAQTRAAILDQVVQETLRRQTVSWKVAETGEELELSISHVRTLFAQPTKAGKMPTERDCWFFLQLCKARGLNPYVGDAFLVGYDSSDGPTFSLITAHQALLKRAEASGKKKGMQSGVIVLATEKAADGTEVQIEKERAGDFFLEETETLVGAWAKVYRSDWDHPQYERLRLSVYNKGHSRWRVDPGGMIVKCAEASATRLAFPRETAGLYIREEMGAMQDDDAKPPMASGNARLRSALQSRKDGGSPPDPGLENGTSEGIDTEPPSPESQEDPTPDGPSEEESWLMDAAGLLQEADTLDAVEDLRKKIPPTFSEHSKRRANEACDLRCQKIRGTRGGRAKRGEMFDTSEAAS